MIKNKFIVCRDLDRDLPLSLHHCEIGRHLPCPCYWPTSGSGSSVSYTAFTQGLENALGSTVFSSSRLLQDSTFSSACPKAQTA